MKKLLTTSVISTLGSLLAVSHGLPALGLSLEDATDAAFRRHGIARVSSIAEVAPRDRGNKSFAFKPVHVVPSGNAYVIVTDQTDPVALKSLEKLARFHSGTIIQLKNFRNLYQTQGERAALIEKLRAANPKYVALAPRTENFSENGLLAIWQLLLRVGNGRLNVYPSFLVAADSNGLAALVDRAIKDQPLRLRDVHPLVLAQYTDPNSGGMRSVEKAAIMEDLFRGLGLECPGLIVRTNSAPAKPAVFPKIGTLGTIQQSGPPIQQFPPEVAGALAASRLLLMFGHGKTGMSCSVDVNAYRNIPMKDDVVLCGSCFSCTPPASDLVADSNGRRPESLAMRAIANGAQVFWGHMHKNSGFPELFVVFESLMKGEPVGQSYQQVMNAIFADTKLAPQSFILSDQELADKDAVDERNHMLFVMIGDPAARPIFE
ncbi:MAG: hypothetical protein JSS83_13525 [Cyanobacteria bacterium SZAS LIN-3]|nr:hypothetical protein [Cyanobacteria bacterium SZAS LIN-3]